MHDDASTPGEEVEYDADTDTYRATYANGSDPASLVVVETVAAITDRDAHDLRPLYEVVDPAALDDAFRPTADGRFRPDGRISFTYEGFDVTVRSYGVIAIEPTDEVDEAIDRPGPGERTESGGGSGSSGSSESNQTP